VRGKGILGILIGVVEVDVVGWLNSGCLVSEELGVQQRC
jgi:hypothetical protein